MSTTPKQFTKIQLSYTSWFNGLPETQTFTADLQALTGQVSIEVGLPDGTSYVQSFDDIDSDGKLGSLVGFLASKIKTTLQAARRQVVLAHRDGAIKVTETHVGDRALAMEITNARERLLDKEVPQDHDPNCDGWCSDTGISGSAFMDNERLPKDS